MNAKTDAPDRPGFGGGEARRSQPEGGGPGVDIRMTLPLPGIPVFLSVRAGRERRNPRRRQAERKTHRRHSLANAVFVALTATIFYAAAFIGILLYAAVLEF